MENSYEIASASLNRMSCKLYQLSNQIATSVITAAKAKIRANLNDLCLKVGSNTIYYKGIFYAGSIDNLEDKNVILEPKDEDTLNEIIHLNKEVNKGVGVEMLAKHMGITLDQVITMGDAGNDLHMIECAGMGVAMGNAFEEVKKAANYITDTNENDGVAKAIEHLVLNS